MDDRRALAQLASAGGGAAPRGQFLLAEVNGELVAAVSLEGDATALGLSSADADDLLVLLDRQAGAIRARGR